MFQEIKTVILAGGTVKHEYKRKIGDWFSEIKISTFQGGPWLWGEPFLKLRDAMVDGELDLDEAIKLFGRAAFGKKNLGVAYEGIRKHKLTEKDLEYLQEDEIKALVKQYFDEFYEQDFPFMAEFE